MPRCVVISKLNHQRADYAGVLEAAQDAFGDKVVPLYVPVPLTRASEIDDLVALLSQTVSDYSERPGGRAVRQPNEDEQLLIDDSRGTLIEGIIEESEDEGLMDRYMGGEEIDIDAARRRPRDRGRARLVLPRRPRLRPDRARPRRAARDHHLGVPAAVRARLPRRLHDRRQDRRRAGVRPVGTAGGRGRQDDVGPVRRPDQPGPRLLRHRAPRRDRARVRALLRVLRTPSAATRTTTRTSASARCRHRSGKTQRLGDSCIAGDICAIAKLSRAETGDTLSDKENPLVMEPWSMPEPLLPIALVAHAKADEDKLGQALQPARRRGPDGPHRAPSRDRPARAVVHGRGARRRAARPAAQPLRRAGRPGRRAGAAARDARRQGHGQGPPREAERRSRPVRRLRHQVEPLRAGSGFEFVDKVVGGSVPRQFIPSVEKGVRAQLEKGLRPATPWSTSG